MTQQEKIDRFSNQDLVNIESPIKVDVLEELLNKFGYDAAKTQYLVNGFRNGFDIGYRGPLDRKDTVNNIPIRDGVGSKIEMWNKVIKEVHLKRYAGPLDIIPFETYMQSPIGLVPKAGDQTRLIFHLSYDFGKEEKQCSLNYFTPKELCSVRYSDLDHTIANCLKIQKRMKTGVIFLAKTDIRSTFHLVPLRPDQYRWLLLKAEDPEHPGKYCYFADKCLPFGASISCAIFQEFSNALKHIMNGNSGQCD